MVAKAAGWVKLVGESPLQLRLLNIGPRLTLCFFLIVLVLLVANGVLIWQFQQARAQADLLSGVDQELVMVLQAHIGLMSFYERLDLLAHSENTDELVREVEALRNALIQDSQRTRNALSQLPPKVQPDPALLPTLFTIEGTLPAELEAITVLAKSKDWEAVRLRLENQIRPLEARSSALVANIDRAVGQERAQALVSIARAQRRILLIVPITGALTLVFAALLGLVITHSVTQPLRRLMEGSAALARGDFSYRVSIEGKDEFARLGDVFNHMILRLQELYRELQRRESYLAEAQKLSQTGSLGWKPASGEIVWSEETYRIFALDRTAQPTVEFILLRTVPEDRQGLQQLVDRATREGKNWDFEHRIVMPDATVKHLHVVAHALHDEFNAGTEYVGAVMDVTERKRSEAALRRSAEQLAAQGAQLHELFEQAPEGIVLLDMEDRVLQINPEFTKIFGYSLDEAMGRRIDELIAPKELRSEAEEYTHRITHGKRVNAETIRCGKDGRRIHVSLLAVPVSLPGGQMFEYAIYRDISERKMFEGELTKQKAQLNELFETIPEAIAQMDLGDVIVRVNPEFSKIFGYSAEEAVGRPLNELVAPGDRRGEAEQFTQQVTGRGETLNVETVRRRKDGSRFPVSIIGVPVSIAGGQIGEYAIYRDITERKRAEEELQQIVDFVPQLIAMLGPDGKVIHANRVAREYTGLTLDEYRSVDVVGRVIHPDDAERMRVVLKRALSTSDPFEVEARLLGKDGAYRWFLFRYNPLVEQGRVRRWYASATEIESRKQKEERVREENVLLEEHTRIAQELHDTLLQSFLGASMQLGALMNSLPSNTQVRPKLDQILQLMEQGIEDGRNAIEGLRSSDSRTLDLVVALSGVQQELAVQPDVDFRVRVAGPQQPIRPLIQQEIYRIGREALVNAFCHSGAKRVEFELQYSEGNLRMWVRDNGCGIDPQVLDAGREGHWGLQGMRERAQRLGAQLALSSRPGAGTEVELVVPAATVYALDATEQKHSGFVGLPTSTPEEL